MDPAAIKELQRLYAKKHAKENDRPSKRRKVEEQSDTGTEDDNKSNANKADESQSDTESEKSVSEDASFRGFDEEEEASPARGAGQGVSEPVEVISFDERSFMSTANDIVPGYKSFMSGKVPKTTINSTNAPKRKGDDEDEDETADDLRKDKELQKLLRESHLLQEQGGDSLETMGKVRHKAIATQLIANGASKQKQRKMPIGMRKGIEAAAKKRESATDKYNRDNGVITARKTTPVVKKKSNRTLHELNVGKFKNGKLTISRREIDRINGPKKAFGKDKKKRGFRDFSNIG